MRRATSCPDGIPYIFARTMFRNASTFEPEGAAPGIGSWKRLDEISGSILRLMLRSPPLGSAPRSSKNIRQSICRSAAIERPPIRLANGSVSEKTWKLGKPLISFSR